MDHGPTECCSFISGPFPCPSGPEQKATALKLADSRYLLVLMGPYLGGSPNHRTGRKMLKALNPANTV